MIISDKAQKPTTKFKYGETTSGATIAEAFLLEKYIPLNILK